MPFEVRFKLPGQDEQNVKLDQSPLMIGSLLSNQIILPSQGVEPIHALLEQVDDDNWLITDLGSEIGVEVNGKKIQVEATIKPGDKISIAGLKLKFDKQKEVSPSIDVEKPQKEKAEPAKKKSPQQQSPAPNRGGSQPKRNQVMQQKDDLLFSPKDAKPSGDVLEVVAYWGDTIIEVEHFHPAYKGYGNVSIGDPTQSHFIAAGDEAISRYVLAKLRDDGYKLKLLPSMTARLRRGGSVEKVEGGSHSMGRRDIAHIKYGAIRYFFLFMRPPSLNLPRSGPKDPFFLGIISITMLFFSIFTLTLWSLNPKDEKEDTDDLWSIVHVPEKLKKIKKNKPEAVKIVKVKEPPPPPKTPPKPKPKPVEPVKVEEKEKPQIKPPQEKKVAKANMQDNLNKPKPKPKAQPAPAPAPAKGIASRKKPGGKIGLGRPGGGIRKGNQKRNIKGVPGVKNNKSSGVNLSKLGVGVGKISSKSGAGAIHTKFRSTVGGGGGGAGSGRKTYGLGGVNSGAKSVGIAGSNNAVNRFGSGGGSIIGSGKGKGLGNAFGSGKRPVSVNVRAGDPLVSGGLSQEEILGVIRAQLNQIRHCYEKLLQRSPNASGKVNVQFIVGTNGRVTSARVKNSTIRDGAMNGCVTSVVRRWSFPRPRGGSSVTVNYPFSFNPL